MAYRALHVISSHRYRLPVRRYILDLFSGLELNEESVAAFNEAASKLPKVSPESQLPKADRLRLSVLPRIMKRHSDSDESGDEDEMDTPPATKVVTDGDNPVLSLLPQRKSVGFPTRVV
jgi:large subunit ribosomal protein L17e